MTIGAQHGHAWIAAILGSLGLHASVYALLTFIEGPAVPMPQAEPIMTYIVPAPRLIPEPLPPPVEPELPEELIEPPPPEPEPEPEPPPPVEPEPATEPAPEPQDEAAPPAPSMPVEPRNAETEGQPPLTRFEWYAAIPEAIARLREAKEQAPKYRVFGDLDALTADATPAWVYELDPTGGDVAAMPLDRTASGEQRGWINERCYESRYAVGSVLEEVHRLSNTTTNCEAGSAENPEDDLFLEAMPAYLERE